MTGHADRLANIARRRNAARAALDAITAESEPAIIAAWQDDMKPRDIAQHLDVTETYVYRIIRKVRDADKIAAREVERKRKMREYLAEHGMKPREQ